MSEEIRVGDPAIHVRLRRSGSARRMILRLSAARGQPVLTAPPSVPIERAAAFVASQEAWLRQRLAEAPGRVRVVPGARLPLRGEPVLVTHRRAGPTTVSDGRLLVSGSDAETPARVAAFLREAARQRAVAAADRFAQRLGRPYRRLTLRDPRSRWGSCTSAGDLMLSWRLIMAPDPVLDYVVAHEVAHLLEMNHSRAYWRALSGLLPGHAEWRAWLRAHGAALHAYDFR